MSDGGPAADRWAGTDIDGITTALADYYTAAHGPGDHLQHARAELARARRGIDTAAAARHQHRGATRRAAIRRLTAMTGQRVPAAVLARRIETGLPGAADTAPATIEARRSPLGDDAFWVGGELAPLDPVRPRVIDRPERDVPAELADAADTDATTETTGAPPEHAPPPRRARDVTRSIAAPRPGPDAA